MNLDGHQIYMNSRVAMKDIKNQITSRKILKRNQIRRGFRGKGLPGFSKHVFYINV